MKNFKKNLIKIWDQYLKTDKDKPSAPNLLHWQRNKIIRYLLEDAMLNNDKEKQRYFREALESLS